MPSFSAKQLASWSGGTWGSPFVGEATGFSVDSRAIRPGEVFVALATEKRDGHDFLPSAQTAGAAAAIVQRFNPSVALPQLIVPDPLRAFQAIARHHREQFKGQVIGI